MIKNIFFDFDGVLAESVHVKTEAFRKMYLQYGEKFADKVVSHHVANGGVSRFEKFKIYNGEWLGQDVSPELVDCLSREFTKLVLHEVSIAVEVTGATAFMEANKKNFKYWIISGTPLVEIRKIAELRAIDHYFEGIYGSPRSKSEWSQYIMKEWKIAGQETVFIGDALADYLAALATSTHFILRETLDNNALFADYKGLRIIDMTCLLNAISKLNL